MGTKQKPDSLEPDRVHIQFRVYDKETVAWMRENFIGASWLKDQVRKAMRKNQMTADGKAAVICSVLANHPGKTYEQIIELSSRIIASAEEMV